MQTTNRRRRAPSHVKTMLIGRMAGGVGTKPGQTPQRRAGSLLLRHGPAHGRPCTARAGKSRPLRADHRPGRRRRDAERQKPKKDCRALPIAFSECSATTTETAANLIDPPGIVAATKWVRWGAGSTTDGLCTPREVHRAPPSSLVLFRLGRVYVVIVVSRRQDEGRR